MDFSKKKNTAAKTELKRVPLSVKNYEQDPSYWGTPLWERACMRLLYAAMAFLCTASFFDVATRSPMWMQIAMGSCVALAVLLFRMAYPKGFAAIWEWIMEGMAEAAEEMEANGKTPKMSSAEIKKTLDEQKALNKIRSRQDKPRKK